MIFAVGVVAGIVLTVSVGIQREERVFHRTGRVSVTRLAPDGVSQGTRGLVGLTVRQPVGLDPPPPNAFAVRRIQWQGPAQTPESISAKRVGWGHDATGDGRFDEPIRTRVARVLRALVGTFGAGSKTGAAIRRQVWSEAVSLGQTVIVTSRGAD